MLNCYSLSIFNNSVYWRFNNKDFTPQNKTHTIDFHHFVDQISFNAGQNKVCGSKKEEIMTKVKVTIFTVFREKQEFPSKQF